MGKAIKKEKYKCCNCNKEYVETNYYKSTSPFYADMGRIPYCKQCIGKFYEYLVDKYANEGCLNPEKKAVKRMCMFMDVYFNDKAYNDTLNDAKKRKMDITPLGAYMKIVQLRQGRLNTYDNTILEEERDKLLIGESEDMSEEAQVDQQIMNFFGNGFSKDDYDYLKREYDDWTARHECKTKAQEEVFKRIVFKQLEILKATQRNEDTKDLDFTFQKLLETAKLQPKQNAGDTVADNQTFGTLIDKYENERPLPEIDEELRDVDKIAWYLDVFFRGHLSKMMGLKNGLSNLYTKFIKQYTVEKPEYKDEENSEVLFDAIFGNPPSDSENDKVVVD